MQTPGKPPRKHGPNADPMRVLEKTRSRCKPQESLRDTTVQMQPSGKTSRKHGQDANRSPYPKLLHCFFERTLAFYMCFYVRFASCRLKPCNSPLEFGPYFLGDFFGGSIFGVPRDPPPPCWRFGHIAAFHTCFYAWFAHRPARGPAERGGER